MKMHTALTALTTGLILGMFTVTSAIAANVDVVNNSTETISVTCQGTTSLPKKVIAPSASDMFGVNLGTKVTVSRERNPSTNRPPQSSLHYFFITNATNTYQVVVSGNADGFQDVTVTEMSGGMY